MKQSLLWLTLLCPFLTSAQTDFYLVKKVENADINYLTVKNENFLEGGLAARWRDWQPVKGQFRVYLFIREFEGGWFDPEIDTTLTLHDVIVLKTDKYDTILDGFFFRMEWSEVPSQSFTFRSFATGKVLTDKFPVDSLELLNEYERYVQNERQEPSEEYNEYGERLLPSAIRKLCLRTERKKLIMK